MNSMSSVAIMASRGMSGMKLGRAHIPIRRLLIGLFWSRTSRVRMRIALAAVELQEGGPVGLVGRVGRGRSRRRAALGSEESFAGPNDMMTFEEVPSSSICATGLVVCQLPISMLAISPKAGSDQVISNASASAAGCVPRPVSFCATRGAVDSMSPANARTESRVFWDMMCGPRE